LVDNLNKENEEKVINEIVKITGLDKSVVEENGIKYYLLSLDENFEREEFEDISRALANAQNNADSNDYYNYFHYNNSNSNGNNNNNNNSKYKNENNNDNTNNL
jgi:thymidine kinase